MARAPRKGAAARTICPRDDRATLLHPSAANQVTGWSYDNAGNLLNDGTTAYTYDALGRALTTGSSSNTYNADGTLVAQTQSNITTRYVQDLASPLSHILGDGTHRYIYGAPAERLFAQQGSADKGLGHRVWGLGMQRITLHRSASETPIPTPYTLQRQLWVYGGITARERCLAAGALVRRGARWVWGAGSVCGGGNEAV